MTGIVTGQRAGDAAFLAQFPGNREEHHPSPTQALDGQMKTETRLILFALAAALLLGLGLPVEPRGARADGTETRTLSAVSQPPVPQTVYR